jgi:hypothetical protein
MVERRQQTSTLDRATLESLTSIVLENKGSLTRVSVAIELEEPMIPDQTKRQLDKSLIIQGLVHDILVSERETRRIGVCQDCRLVSLVATS